MQSHGRLPEDADGITRCPPGGQSIRYNGMYADIHTDAHPAAASDRPQWATVGAHGSTYCHKLIGESGYSVPPPNVMLPLESKTPQYIFTATDVILTDGN
eukprot:4819315-Amphidinium_carterae.1